MENSKNNSRKESGQKATETKADLIARLTKEVHERGYPQESLTMISFIAEHNPFFFNTFKIDYSFMGKLEYQKESFLRDLTREEERLIKLQVAKAESINEGKNPASVFVINSKVLDIEPFLTVIEFGGVEHIIASLDTLIFEFISLLSKSDDSQLDNKQAEMIWITKRMRDAFMYGSKGMPALTVYDDAQKQKPFTC